MDNSLIADNIINKEYYIQASMSYDIRHGKLKNDQPKYDNPSDYGLSRKQSINARIRYLRAEKAPLEHELAYLKTELFNNYNYYTEGLFLIIKERIEKLNNQIRFNLDRIKFKEDKGSRYDIESIKKIPLDTLVKVNSMGFFMVRNERTPSCKWYKDTNTWVDFGGDNKSHDIIDLYQILNNCDLKTALKELSTSY